MDRFSQYKVQLAALPEGKFEQDFVCDTEFFKHMESIDVIAGDVDVHLEISHKNNAYNCSFQIDGEIQIPCDRCLEPMTHIVEADYDIVVKYGYEYDDSSDEVLIIPEEQTSFDVSQIIHDTILLTIPIRHIHQEGECNAEMAEKFLSHLAESDDEDDEEEF